MPFVPDKPSSGFVPDQPQSGFVPDSPAPNVPPAPQTGQDPNFWPGVKERLGKYGVPAAAMVVGGALPEAGVLATSGINAGLSGAQRALSNYIQGKPTTEGVAQDTAAGGLGTLALKGASKALGTIGDYLMQKGVGMRKNIPGVGERLANQGMWGTKGMLANQAEKKLPEAEQKVQNVVSNLTEKTPATEIHNAVSQLGKKFLNPDSGLPFEGNAGSYNQVQEASAIPSTGEYSPEALLKLKRAADYEGYTASGNPATSLKAEIEQAKANKARELLSKMSGGASANALADEQALILANKALNKPEAIHQGIGSNMFFGKYPGQSILSTTGGQAAIKSSHGLQNLPDPKVLQGLFGIKNASE